MRLLNFPFIGKIRGIFLLLNLCLAGSSVLAQAGTEILCTPLAPFRDDLHIVLASDGEVDLAESIARFDGGETHHTSLDVLGNSGYSRTTHDFRFVLGKRRLIGTEIDCQECQGQWTHSLVELRLNSLDSWRSTSTWAADMIHSQGYDLDILQGDRTQVVGYSCKVSR